MGFLRHAEIEPRRHGECDAGQGPEDLAPGGEGQNGVERGGRDEGAKRAGGHDPSGERGHLFRLGPLRESLERGHQAGRHAEADQSAAECQHVDRRRSGEDGSTKRRGEQQERFDTARTEAVEKKAERELCRTEGDEIRARQQTEIRRAKRQLGAENRADDRVDRAEMIREEVGAGEGQKKSEPEHEGKRVDAAKKERSFFPCRHLPAAD